MKIAIDLSQMLFGSGVSHYRENLVKNLLEVDTENKYLLFGGSLRQYHLLEEKINSLKGRHEAKTFPIPPTLADLIWNRLHKIPIEKLLGEVDLIHTSDWTEPPSKYPKVTTIHDLIALKFPKITQPSVVSVHKERIKWVYKESRKIIVPSLSTKKDLMDLGFEEERIRVIYEAPNLTKANQKNVEEVKKKYQIYDNYIIAIGVNPRKNIQKMIEAFHLSKSGKNLKFVIAGERKGMVFENERGVRFLGRISDYDLAALLTGSKALVYASLYEGLGIPILDAFNCEVPVVTSNISSMPEVAGGAAILVNPTSTNSIADGIEEALSKPKTLIAKGLRRVEDFSWRKCAKETLEIYKGVKNNLK